jgi:hypothetical protein
VKKPSYGAGRLVGQVEAFSEFVGAREAEAATRGWRSIAVLRSGGSLPHSDRGSNLARKIRRTGLNVGIVESLAENAKALKLLRALGFALLLSFCS